MGRSRHLAFLLVSFVGCVVGSGLATTILSRPAQAQSQVVGGQQVPPNIRNSDVLFIPNAGLRLVTEDNRTLGVIGQNQGNAVLTLLDSAGEPSVLLGAGLTGKLLFSGDGEGQLTVRGPVQRQFVSIKAGANEASITLNPGGTWTGGASGGSLSLRTASGQDTARLTSGSDGGTFELFGGKAPYVQVRADSKGGTLAVRGSDGQSAFTANGAGAASIRQGDKTLWKIPEEE
ncbi:MAG: hypothetical protein KIT11_10205 [Fimbriimonadaceae bacterium]|nr:hypothetical protein [Fimbriimonadaceae bacterium]QYK55694.1 MAG: hypothetical protein KF733_11875 [Fimbriimonadaceae bacterium]